MKIGQAMYGKKDGSGAAGSADETEAKEAEYEEEKKDSTTDSKK